MERCLIFVQVPLRVRMADKATKLREELQMTEIIALDVLLHIEDLHGGKQDTQGED